MRWAIGLMCLATICGIAIVIRGAVVRDGLSLLAVAFAAASLVAALVSHLAEKERQARDEDEL
jgi:hypothetical protein